MRTDKDKWLDKYYPQMKERFIIPENVSKCQCIIKYCEANNILLDDVIYIDDNLSFLREAERCGIRVYHISSFLDFQL